MRNVQRKALVAAAVGLGVGVLAAGSLAAETWGGQPGRQRQPGGGQSGERSAPKPTLTVGAEAPKMSVDTWVQGDAVTKFEEGKVYVVEFWATWCKPCIDAIPHLNKLHEKHKDDGLTVIGVAASERTSAQGGPDRRLQGVQQFVRGKGKQMGYTVAYDGDRTMWNAWMAPAGRRGIPSSFVVGGDGKIAWIGNPNAGDFDDAVSKALERAKKDAGSKPKDEKTDGEKKPSETDVERRKREQTSPLRKDAPADKKG